MHVKMTKIIYQSNGGQYGYGRYTFSITILSLVFFLYDYFYVYSFLQVLLCTVLATKCDFQVISFPSNQKQKKMPKSQDAVFLGC